MRAGFRAAGIDGPEPYQLDVAASIRDQNVVLVSPTGSGKTAIALAPFLDARRSAQPLADRLIYATPVRTLLNAARQTMEGHLGRQGVRVATQSGEEPLDPYFQAEVTFTTIDQVLSAFLFQPVSLPRRERNIPAGALVGAYVVFDEFHLLDPRKALLAAVTLAKRFGPLTRIVLMSATCPHPLAKLLAREVDGRLHIIDADQARFRTGRTRSLRLSDGSLDAATVAKHHAAGSRTLVVCNTVDRAQNLFEALSGVPGLRREQVHLLHSRYTQPDRGTNERCVLTSFGKDALPPGHGVVVTTQVAEVGLDLSFTTLLTELAPASALVQRAGRCARRRDESGTITVFQVPHHAPYERAHLGAAAEALNDLGASDAAIPWDDSAEANFVNAAGGAEASARMEAVMTLRRPLLTEIGRDDRSIVRRYVRDIASSPVVLLDSIDQSVFPKDPEEVRRGPRSVAVSWGALQGFLGDLAMNAADAGAVWCADIVTDTDEEGEHAPPRAAWRKVTKPEDIATADVVGLCPGYGTYRPDVGLALKRGATREFRDSDTMQRGRPDRTRGAARIEAWRDHAWRALLAWREQDRDYSAGMHRLARLLGVPGEQLRTFLEVLPLLHDVGKLSEEWQEGIWRRETASSGSQRSGVLAHSSTAERKGFPKLSTFPKLPNHSAEGAFWLMPFLQSRILRLEGFAPEQRPALLSALLGAISRHHAPGATGVCRSRPMPEAAAEVAIVSRVAHPSIADPVLLQEAIDQSRMAVFVSLLPAPDSNGLAEWAWPIYTYLVHRLRLADRRAVRLDYPFGRE